MAPSTVFAYWRRDHRRQASSSRPDSPLAVAPTVSSADSGPPQLPQLPSTPTLSDTIIESAGLSDSLSPSPFTEHPPDVPKVDGRGSHGQSARHSSANFPVPSPSSEDPARPHSSPENGVKQGGFTSQLNHSQQSIPVHRPDHSEMNSHKPSSPWRRGFGKGILSHQADDHKGGASHGGTAGSGLRINTTAQGAGRSSTKESKLESVSSRREGHHHDPPAEHVHQKSGKTKFHLLNPMSLLARRRSSQFLSSRQEEVKFAAQSVVPAIPDDYDPRIRGNIVHDFSAPRPRRNVPVKGSGHEPQASAQESSGAEQQKPWSEHSPVFKEHFGEDRKPLQVENKGYLQSELMTNSTLSDRDPSELPAFARKLPLRVPENDNSKPVEQTIEVPNPEPRPPSPPREHSPPRHPPKETTDAAQQAPGVPSRLKSDASRFSFDMGGVGSSVQEKLLEEKHKEKEAARRQQALLERSSYSDFDEDDFDYDAMEDDGGIEEKIPGVNADADDDEFNSGVHGVVGTAQTSLFVPALPTIAASPISPTGSHSGILAKPQDAQGQAAGNVTTSDPTSLNQRRPSSDYGDDTDAAGQKIGPGSESAPAAAGNKEAKASQSIDDDDLYYDDGGFDELPADAGDGVFDESVFDDENSHLYQRKFYPGTRIPIGTEGLPGPDHPEGPVESESSKNSDLRHMPSLASEFRHDPSRFSGAEAPKATGGVLTEQNLEAFHNALARVAEEAAAGKGLQRNMSVSETSLGQDSAAQTADSHPGLISDDSRLSHQTMGFDDVADDFNYDDYDGYDDDPIIAEANAEALENDDEGFYGREFGFYAHAHGNCDPEPFHGGYFGPRGVEGINRSHSGRGNFREPSLTPITERSEWSTRNSIISLTTHGAAAAAQSNPSLSSPGLAQLVDMGNIDDEMSLEALMKLRRGAFGGSNGSLRSSAGSLSPQAAPAASSNRCSFLSIPEDGPMLNTTAEGSSPLADPTGAPGGGHYVSSPLIDRESIPGSPTLTLHQPAGLRQGLTGEGGEAVRAAVTAAKASHSRNSSSASISYVQETNEDGSSKWVLERRRLSDSGEVEVYEREVLGEGRI
ncbi:hypothetical protein VTN96DRAFT_7258 [Rasamsonia emersonii]|uniref:Uncharacterized protein n=1 Tax=Rasamsonia emersonii (strain ATCC 16479 / CBS 393.64 / IMI 116815) TaxID=1408163 RepID=A0A0F4YUH6_RASE3|nr:hypothetical protein T310_4266 [Rasamsonia emersonii CBS 393.64]KKA21745.1 hypothetical protein T310_4266 [Rasamsonia emersonii CBS 393.64]